jgi:hypothetical protein
VSQSRTVSRKNFKNVTSFIAEPDSRAQVYALEENVKEFGLTYFGMDDKRQGECFNKQISCRRPRTDPSVQVSSTSLALNRASPFPERPLSAVIRTLRVSRLHDEMIFGLPVPHSTRSFRSSCLWHRHIRSRARSGNANSASGQIEEHANLRRG